MPTKREQYTAEMKTRLDELNQSIDALEAKANDAKHDVKEMYKAELKKVRHQSKVTMEKFDEMKLAGEDSWDKMVTEMEKLKGAFVHSFHYFKSQVK